MKKIWLCLAMLTVSSLAFAGSGEWISVDSGSSIIEEPFITTTSNSAESIDIEIIIPGFIRQKALTKEGSYEELLVPDQSFLGKIGQAKLPAVRMLIEVPHQASLLITPGKMSVKTYRLSDLGFSNIIAPVQEHIEKTPDGYEKWRFSKDEKYYSTDAFMPNDRVTIEKVFHYRSHRIVQITVAPVAYNPKRGEVNVYHHLKATLTFRGGNESATMKAIQQTWSPSFEKNLESMVLNYGMFSGKAAKLVPKSSHWEGMLIISAPEYFSAADQLAQWRAKTGYYVSHVTTTETGPSVAEIKAYIQNIYDTWTDPALTLVMLVGDVDTVPTPPGAYCGNCPSDSDYACLEGGDNVHDIYVGRVSISNVTQANTVFSRFMNYTKATFTGMDWIKKACFSSSCDSTYNIYLTHEVCLADYMLPNGYSGTYYPPGNDPGGDLIRCIEDYGGDSSASGADVINTLNEGRSLITYSGHCSPTSWSGPYVGVSDIQGASPGDMSPFMTGHCCSGHDIDYPSPCIGEVCLREVAIGYYGSSNSSNWGPDDYLQIAWFDKIFTDNQHRMGEFTTNGVIDMYFNYDASDYYMDMELLGGDPSMELYTEIPTNLSAFHSGTMYLGTSTYSMTVFKDGSNLPGARVCLIKNDAGDDIHGFGITDGAGFVNITLDSPPAAPGTLQITITAINAIPLEDTALVVSPSGPWFIYEDHLIDDSSGNNDGLINPDESIIMPVTIENVGLDTGTGISATLSTTSGYCLITDNYATFPDTAASSSAQSLPDHYAFTIDPSTPDNEPILFTLDWTAAGGYSGSTIWTETVVRPVVSYTSHVVDDSSGGNNNSFLDPGETVFLEVSLTNQGGCPAIGVQATLTDDSSSVSILDDQATWPDLNSGQTLPSNAPHFEIEASGDTPIGHPVNFQLDIMTGDGYTFTENFQLIVGTKGFVLVINDGSGTASSIIANTLANMQYIVTEEQAASSNPVTWPTYDFIVHSSGNNANPVTTHRQNLINYVQSGGKLFLEGGEVLYDMYYASSDFLTYVMHCVNWQHDSSGDHLQANDPSHPVASIPNVLPATISHTYGSYENQDSGAVASDASAVFTWSSYTNLGGIIAYDDDSNLYNSGQIVVCTFNISNLTNNSNERDHLIENIACWLTGSCPNPDVPELSLLGFIILLIGLSWMFFFVKHRRVKESH